jgi:hypothetical protein
MAFGLERGEIETLVERVIREHRDRPKGGVFGQDPALPIWIAMAEAITQNNVKILEDLTKAGVNI